MSKTKGSQHNYKYSSMYAKSLHKIEWKVKKLFQNLNHTIICWRNMDNNQDEMMASQSSTPSQKVRGKPTELKTIDQLKATDRPADVEQKLRERGQELLDKLMDTCAGIKRLPKAMRGDTSQLIKAMFSSLRTTDLWMRDVTATATQIVEKFNELQQDQITQRTR